MSVKTRILSSASAAVLSLAFTATTAAAENCSVVTPATDVLLAKMAGKITGTDWLSNLGPTRAASEFAEAFVDLKGGDPWFEDVSSDIIYGDAVRLAITGPGQAFRAVSACTSAALMLPRGLAEAAERQPDLLEQIAKALPESRVTKASSSGRTARDGMAIELSGSKSLQELYKAIVGGGELPLGVDMKDVSFSKG
ncbi:hypothetical protein ACOXXX_11030 [Thalassococcus sp. BH17M4-6]|uniref:hypothetical protein n=1 Tax=Thalassococcus sp. BH17M4-6 TaxID=3413148 RepID=UPI003BB9E123